MAFHPLLRVILQFRSGISVSSGEADTTDAGLRTTGISCSAAFRVVTDFLTGRALFAPSFLDQCRCRLLRDTIPRRHGNGTTGLAPSRRVGTGVRCAAGAGNVAGATGRRVGALAPDSRGGVRSTAGAGNVAGATGRRVGALAPDSRGGVRSTAGAGNVAGATGRRVGALAAPACRGGNRSTAGARDVTGPTRPGRHESEITGTMPAACRVGGSVPAGPDVRRSRGAGPADAPDTRRGRGAGPAGARDVAGVQVPALRRQPAPRRRRPGRVSRAAGAGAGAVLCCTIEHTSGTKRNQNL
jgi:hypothetical protein